MGGCGQRVFLRGHPPEGPNVRAAVTSMRLPRHSFRAADRCNSARPDSVTGRRRRSGPRRPRHRSSHKDFAARSDGQGTTDSLPALPGTTGHPANIAHSGYGEVEGSSEGRIRAQPEIAAGFAQVVAIRIDGPGARREQQAGTHAGNRACEIERVRKVAGADRHAGIEALLEEPEDREPDQAGLPSASLARWHDA